MDLIAKKTIVHNGAKILKGQKFAVSQFEAKSLCESGLAAVVPVVLKKKTTKRKVTKEEKSAK